MVRRIRNRWTLALALGAVTALPVAAQDAAADPVPDQVQQTDERPLAQDRNPERRRERVRERVESRDGIRRPREDAEQVSDAALARWLIDDHRMEIEISRRAAEILGDEQIVQFAGRMVEDHGRLVGTLEPLAERGDLGPRDRRAGRDGERDRRRDGDRPRDGDRLRDGERRRDGDRPSGETVEVEAGDTEVEVEVDQRDEDAREGVLEAVRDTARAARRTVDEAEGVVDQVGDRLERRFGDRPQRRGGVWLGIKDELTDQKVESAIQTIERYPADERGQVYLGLQVANHQDLLDTITVFKRRASAEMVPILEENERAVRSHLERAEELMGEQTR